MTLTKEEIENMGLDPSDELMWDDFEELTASYLLVCPEYEKRVKTFLGFTEDDGVSWVDTYAIIDCGEKRVHTLRSVFVDNVNHREEELEIKITNIPEMEMIYKSLDKDSELTDEIDGEMAVAVSHDMHVRDSESDKKHEYLDTIKRLAEFMDAYRHEDFTDYGEDISGIIRILEESPESIVKTLLDFIEEGS